MESHRPPQQRHGISSSTYDGKALYRKTLVKNGQEVSTDVIRYYFRSFIFSFSVHYIDSVADG